MKKIKLENSHRFALVDDHWYDALKRHEWREYKRPGGRTAYAYRRVRRPDGSWERIFMHRQILGREPGDGRQVDHIDGDGTNNLEANLRIATRSQNQANKRVSRHSSTGYKGVSRHRQTGKWQAQATLDGRVIPLGLFPTEAEGALAYNIAATALHNEFALVNVIPADQQPGPERADQIRRQVAQSLARRLGTPTPKASGATEPTPSGVEETGAGAASSAGQPSKPWQSRPAQNRSKS